MSKDNLFLPERVTRYNLTIAFEELYTRENTQLDAAANAIGVAASAIEELLATDMALQTLLKVQNLRLNIVAPGRVSASRQAGIARGNKPLRSNQ